MIESFRSCISTWPCFGTDGASALVFGFVSNDNGGLADDFNRDSADRGVAGDATAFAAAEVAAGNWNLKLLEHPNDALLVCGADLDRAAGGKHTRTACDLGDEARLMSAKLGERIDHERDGGVGEFSGWTTALTTGRKNDVGQGELLFSGVEQHQRDARTDDRPRDAVAGRHGDLAHSCRGDLGGDGG